MFGLFQNVFDHFQGNQPNFLLLIRPTYQIQMTNQNRLQMILPHHCHPHHFLPSQNLEFIILKFIKKVAMLYRALQL